MKFRKHSATETKNNQEITWKKYLSLDFVQKHDDLLGLWNRSFEKYALIQSIETLPPPKMTQILFAKWFKYTPKYIESYALLAWFVIIGLEKGRVSSKFRFGFEVDSWVIDFSMGLS